MFKQKSLFINKVQIFPDWDVFPSYKTGLRSKSYFAGREDDVSRLSSWLANGGGGSVLVSGVRGIGKTAFVHHSIRASHKKLGGRRVTVVPINAALIDPARIFLLNKDKDDRAIYEELTKPKDIDRSYLFWQYIILQQLVASLHFAKVRNHTLRHKLSDLYRWSISEGSKTQVSESLTGIKLAPDWLEKILPYISFVSLGWIIIIPSWLPSIIFAITSTLLISVTRVKNQQSELKIRSSNFDYLYSELNSILNNPKEIFIFVVDELDKIGSKMKISNQHNPEEKDGFIDFLLRSFKNLLTISSGRFIFITGEEYYLDWLKKKNVGHPERSTFFNWDIFLVQAEVKDLVEYFQKICVHKSDISDDFASVLAYALYLQTGGHYSEMVRQVRFYVKYDLLGYKIFNRKAPFIHMDNYKSFAQTARLGKILENVVKQRAVRSVDRLGFEYFKTTVLHEVVRHISNRVGTIGGGTKAEFDDHFIKYGLETVVGIEITDEDKIIVKNQIQDLLIDLNNLVSSGSETLNWNLGIEPSSIVSYEMTKESIAEYIDDLPDKRTELTVMEERLVSMAESLFAQLQHWIDIFGNKLVETPNDFIEMIDDSLNDKYVSAMALAEKVDLQAKKAAEDKIREQTIDPRAINNSIDIIEDINHQIGNTENIVARYLSLLLVGVNLQNNILIGKNRSAEIVQSGFGSILRIATSRVKRFLVKDKINGKDLEILSREVAGYLGVKKLNGKMSDWHVTSADGAKEGSWHEVVMPITTVNKEHSFLTFRCSIRSTSDYWRFGIALGCKETNIRPLNGQNYTLIHLYKNVEFETIWYRVIWNKLVRKQLEKGELSKDKIEIPNSQANQPITFELKRAAKNSTTVWIYVNGIKLRRVKTPKDDFYSLSMLAWGDDKDYAIEVDNVSFETTVD